MTRLIDQQRRTGRIRDHRLGPPARPFATVYTTADALLLAEVDEAFGQLSGPATKRILWRMFHVFGDKRFERLAEISNGHIYNLRARRAYRRARTTFRKTRRHRLNRGGNRQANPALHMIVVCRMRTDERTRTYVRRRTEEGLSKREVMRCLKRYVAREVSRVLTAP